MHSAPLKIKKINSSSTAATLYCQNMLTHLLLADLIFEILNLAFNMHNIRDG